MFADGARSNPVSDMDRAVRTPRCVVGRSTAPLRASAGLERPLCAIEFPDLNFCNGVGSSSPPHARAAAGQNSLWRQVNGRFGGRPLANCGFRAPWQDTVAARNTTDSLGSVDLAQLPLQVTA